MNMNEDRIRIYESPESVQGQSGAANTVPAPAGVAPPLQFAGTMGRIRVAAVSGQPGHSVRPRPGHYTGSLC